MNPAVIALINACKKNSGRTMPIMVEPDFFKLLCDEIKNNGSRFIYTVPDPNSNRALWCRIFHQVVECKVEQGWSKCIGAR